MRELNLVELQSISGGYNNKGYTFTFIIENTISWAMPCFAIGLLSGTGQGTISFTMLGAGIGATYATAMMFTTAIDHYAFSQEPSIAQEPSIVVVE